MRKIKFRAWDKDNKEMVEIWSVSYEYRSTQINQIFALRNKPWQARYSSETYELENYIRLQYTGLKDKNGVEIYEGDILKINNNPEHIVVVEWTTPDKWHAKKCPVNGWINNESIYGEKPEVIGNVYQNKELLREAK